MQQGDRNTRFFHICASQRKRKNTIAKIIDVHGGTLRKQEDIEGAFGEYFTKVYTSSSPTEADIEECIYDLEPKISSEMRKGLEGIFRREEVKRALKQMSPWKSPGPNGFGAEFYQRHWDFLGIDINDVVLDF